MNIVKDRVGQEIQEGDLIYIVVMQGQSIGSRIGRVIKIDSETHIISTDQRGSTPRKSLNPNHFCRIESTPYTKPIELEIDTFYTEWKKKHKDFK